MRRAFTGNHGEGFFKLRRRAASCASRSSRMITGAVAVALRQFLLYGTRTIHACMHTHVWRGITLKRQHVVPVEDVAVVRFLERSAYFTAPIPTALPVFPARRLAYPGSFLPPDGVTFQGFIQQIGQFHCTTRAGLNGLPSLPSIMPNMWCSSGTIPVHSLLYGRSPMPASGVDATGVDVIQHAIGMQCFITIFPQAISVVV